MSSHFDTDEALEVMKWLNGEDDGVLRYKGMPNSNQEWFIIDNVWLKKWKKLAGFLQEDLDVQELGEIDNSDLIDNSDEIWKEEDEIILKNSLALSIDYEILPIKAWKYFVKKYGCKDGSEISRRSIEITRFETQVEVKYKPIKIIVWRAGKWETDKPVTIYTSRKAWMRDFRLKFRRIMREKIKSLLDDDDIKVWKLDPTVSFDDLKELAKNNQPPIKFPGKTFEANAIIEEAEIADEDIIVIEVRKYSLEWTFTKELPTKRCESCRAEIRTGVECKCKKFWYCNDNCMNRDSRFHSCNNGKLSNSQYSYQSQNNYSYNSNPYSNSSYNYSPPEKRIATRSSYSKLGIVGLQNLGNTCFMNSGLQCVSNTFILTEFFLSDGYVNEINRDNPMGTRGNLVEEYAALVKEMWYGTGSSVSPWNFKRAFCRFATQFSGFNQHDSQEMVSFLLDGIHEDLNKVKTKPYVSELKTAGLQDAQIAQLFWDTHISRNQSIIVDYMYGQYRSEVECPDCFTKSLAFDPFLMLTLPIPANQQTSLELIFIPYNSQSAIKIKIQIQENAYFKEVKQEVGRLLSIHPNCIALASLSQGYAIERFIEDDERVSKNLKPYAYQTPDITNNDCVINVSFYKETSSYIFSSSSSPAGFQRFIVLNKNANMEAVHHAVFEFVANMGNIELYPNLREKFNQCLPSLFGGRDSDIYSLKLINPNQKKNYYSQVKPCPFCLQVKCNNCPLPYTEEPLIDYVEKSKESVLKIEVTFSKNIGFSLNTLSSIETHVSCQENIRPKSSRITLYDCLAQFSQPERLDQNNTTYCSKCKEHKRGLKKMDIYKLPNILIIHLKRFKHSQYYSNSKNDKLVEFPIEGLDMSDFSITQGAWIYDLYAISNHYGSLDGGHYTAYAKNHENGRWYEFDDSHASPISEPVENTLIKSSAYVLFYKKRD